MSPMLNQNEIVKRVQYEDYNRFPKTEKEVIYYLSQFSVEFQRENAVMVKKIDQIDSIKFKSYLNSDISLIGTDLNGKKGSFHFHSIHVDGKFITDIYWRYL